MGWLDPNHNDVSWPAMALPTFWEAAGYPNVDGIFYFRGTFMLTEEQAQAGGTLYLGAIDDGDWTYVNGVQVGATPNAYAEPRVYQIKPGVLSAGTNKIAFRIYDGQGGGGFSADPGAFYLETPAGKVSLAGNYKYNIGEFRVNANPNQVATILYNAMIAPLAGYPLKGVLWYQGESNAGPEDNVAYADLMKGLVNSWRAFFDQPELPFYWVQLANFMDPVTTPDEPGWAILRESQTKALALPHTGQAVITDIGEANDIHPRNKWEVGRRLSLHALKGIYGKEIQASSPMLKAVHDFEGMTFLEIKEVGGGLMVKSDNRYGYPTGFTVMDDAGDWHFAQALLYPSENLLSIVNPAGTGIKMIRYNWANNPDGNIFSVDGLPLTPFEVKID
jgi:sialate O-acetylesterase